MIRLAAMKATGARTWCAGRRYGRARCGSRTRRARSAIGPNAYMIAVADVTRPTRDCQLGNGRNAISPTTKAMRIETTGTPFLLTCATGLGTAFSRPSAYDSRDDVAVYTRPVPAGEITASA